MSRRFDLCGTGSMVLDQIYRAPRIVGSEEKGLLKAPAGEPMVRNMVGGVLLNQFGWARIMGLEVAIFGRQGNDPEGRFLREGMDRIGITRYIDLVPTSSSFAQIFVDDAGERAIYMARGATAELERAGIDRWSPIIESSSMVSTEVSQVPLAAALRVLEIARAAGALTVLDLDVPKRDAVPALGTADELEALLGLADILKPSGAVLGDLVSATDPPEAARELARRFGARVVAITLGGEGSLVLAEGECVLVPAARVQVVDTTGAGDAFLGGFLAGRHFGLDWEGAARLGNACGATCCERIGAFPDAPAACRKRALEHYADLGGDVLAIPSFEAESTIAVHEATAHFLRTVPRELERVAREADREALLRAAKLIREREETGGRVHVTGIGKPGHVAAYTAALLASTGTPAVWLDASEATHGSVGQIREGDVVIAISNSGATAELLACADAILGMGGEIIAVTRDLASPLAERAAVTLRARVEEEGGPLGLAPRASIQAELLVLGALSVELQATKGIDRNDYHRRHPGGALGARTAKPTDE